MIGHTALGGGELLSSVAACDVDKKVIQAYGVWKEKSMYGRTYMGIERTTYVIDEQGKIARVFPKVKVDSHLEDVLGELESLS